MAQVVTLIKSSPRKKAKLKKDEQRPEWNDAISDLSIHRPTPQELERKRLMCKSKNAEIAKLALLKRDLNKLNKKSEDRKDKSPVLKALLIDPDNKQKNRNGIIKLNDRTSPIKYVGRPVTTPAPKNQENEAPKSSGKKGLSSRSRQRSPASSDSSPIRRIGRCANKLQSIYSGSENVGCMSNQRLDKLVGILKKLSSALDSLETKVIAKVDEEGDKPKLDSIGNVAAFNEQLLSEFCRLVNLFQNVTQQLDKERNLREQLSLEVVRQGNLIEELSVELLQIEQHQSQPSSDRHTSTDPKTATHRPTPETCRTTNHHLNTREHAKFKTKGSVSLPSILEYPLQHLAHSIPRPSTQILPYSDTQSRKRSNLAITLSKSQLLKSTEEMATAIFSTVCSADRGEMRPLATSTSLTYIMEDECRSAVMLTLPQQRDTSKDLIYLEMNASWLPDARTLRRTSPNDWKKSSAAMIATSGWQEPMPQTPPPSRERSPVLGSEEGELEEGALITDCQAPFPFDDSPPPMTLDLFQESTDASESCRTLQEDGDLVMSSSVEGDFMSDTEVSEKVEGKGEQPRCEMKRRLDMEELLSKLEALQTHYMSAHIKLQSLVDRSSATNSPTTDNELSRDVTPRCQQKSG